VAAGVILANEAQEEPLSFTGTYEQGGAQNSDASVTGNYEHSSGHVNPKCTTFHSLPIEGALNGMTTVCGKLLDVQIIP